MAQFITNFAAGGLQCAPMVWWALPTPLTFKSFLISLIFSLCLTIWRSKCQPSDQPPIGNEPVVCPRPPSAQCQINTHLLLLGRLLRQSLRVLADLPTEQSAKQGIDKPARQHYISRMRARRHAKRWFVLLIFPGKTHTAAMMCSSRDKRTSLTAITIAINVVF